MKGDYVMIKKLKTKTSTDMEGYKQKKVSAKENPLLRKRFSLYKKLYESNKQNFEEFGRLTK